MDQERDDYAEPGSSYRLSSFWAAVLVVVVIVSLFVVIFFDDELMIAIGVRKVRE